VEAESRKEREQMNGEWLTVFAIAHSKGQ